MKKFILLIIISISIVYLCSCSKNYNKKDAIKFVENNNIIAEYISEEKQNDKNYKHKNTLWTFKDTTHNFEFHVLESWNNSFPSGGTLLWERSNISTDYIPCMIEHYYKEYSKQLPCTNKEDYIIYDHVFPQYMYSLNFNFYAFNNKEVLKESIQEYKEFNKYLESNINVISLEDSDASVTFNYGETKYSNKYNKNIEYYGKYYSNIIDFINENITEEDIIDNITSQIDSKNLQDDN